MRQSRHVDTPRGGGGVDGYHDVGGDRRRRRAGPSSAPTCAYSAASAGVRMMPWLTGVCVCAMAGVSGGGGGGGEARDARADSDSSQGDARVLPPVPSAGMYSCGSSLYAGQPRGNRGRCLDECVCLSAC